MFLLALYSFCCRECALSVCKILCSSPLSFLPFCGIINKNKGVPESGDFVKKETKEKLERWLLRVASVLFLAFAFFCAYLIVDPPRPWLEYAGYAGMLIWCIIYFIGDN